jgi:transposase
MSAPFLRAAVSPRLRAMQKLVPRLRMAHVLSLPEEGFGNLILSIERDPVFQKYLYADGHDRRIFSCRRFTGTGISTGFLELNESVARSSSGGGESLEHLLEEKKAVVDLCRRIGLDDFKTYFLENDGAHSPNEIAKALDLDEHQVRETLDLVTRVAVAGEFDGSPAPDPATRTYYTRVATVEKSSEGALHLCYNTMRYARGRYMIDYTRLDALKGDPNVPRSEIKRLKDLIKSMELVNARRTTVHQILESIIEVQKAFLLSGRAEDLKDFSQQDLAAKIGVHGSTVSRAVTAKAIGTPWNEELPLKALLGHGSVNAIKARLADIIAREDAPETTKDPFPDEEIRNLLKAEFNIHIALRTVAKYRAELGIPNVYKRARFPDSALPGKN